MLSAELLAFGAMDLRLLAAPLGEVLRGMLPLAAEIRRGKIWSLTDSGRDAALGNFCWIRRPTIRYAGFAHARKAAAFGGVCRQGAAAGRRTIRALERKGFIVAEQIQTERDPLRAPAEWPAHRTDGHGSQR